MKIALIPISAKPYHAGHHYLIETAAAKNDKVIVFASISDRKRKGEFPVHGKTMHEIWKSEILKIMPDNVDVVFGGSPVRKVYEMIGDACEGVGEHDLFMVYSDVVDTKMNYPRKNREKYMEPLWSAGHVTFAAEIMPESFIRGGGAPDVSAENVRHHLQNRDFIEFSKCMPPGLNSYACWSKLLNFSSSQYN